MIVLLNPKNGEIEVKETISFQGLEHAILNPDLVVMHYDNGQWFQYQNPIEVVNDKETTSTQKRA